jgi:hypothetical protein
MAPSDLIGEASTQTVADRDAADAAPLMALAPPGERDSAG